MPAPLQIPNVFFSPGLSVCIQAATGRAPATRRLPGSPQDRSPLVRDVGVSVEGDVRHGVVPTDEEVVALQVLLHDPERVVPELSLGLEGGPAFFRLLCVENVKPGVCHGNVRLVAVLLDVCFDFTAITPCVFSNPSNAPVISASPSAYMVTLRRIIL